MNSKAKSVSVVSHPDLEFSTEIDTTEYRGLIVSMWTRLEKWRRDRANAKALENLNDFMLQDIGLQRHTIGHSMYRYGPRSTD